MGVTNGVNPFLGSLFDKAIKDFMPEKLKQDIVNTLSPLLMGRRADWRTLEEAKIVVTALMVRRIIPGDVRVYLRGTSKGHIYVTLETTHGHAWLKVESCVDQVF